MTTPLNKSSMSDARNETGSLSLFRALVYATVLAGALDAIDGVVFFGLHGLNTIQVLQYIASGLLGASSFRGGLATAGLGVLVHFSIALVVAPSHVTTAALLNGIVGHALFVGLPVAFFANKVEKAS